MSTAAIEVLVKYSAGAYVTNTVKGRRASSTVSAGQAVARLGKKLHGADVQGMHSGTRLGCEVWTLPALEVQGAAS